MMDFLFFVKTVMATIAIVLLLQIEVGNQTIERNAMNWVQSSAVVGPLNTVARGAGKLIHDLTGQVYSSIHSNVKKEEAPKGGTSFIWQHKVKPAPAPKSSEH